MAVQVDRPGLKPARARRWGLIVPVAVLGGAVVVPVVALLVSAFLAGWKFQPITTASMAPHHQPGSLAVVEPLDASLVRPGMVIVFEDPMTRGRRVAHRVVEPLPGYPPKWKTKGDANAVNDPLPVSAQAIRGRVRWTIPGAGTLVTAFSGSLAPAVLVGIPLLLLALTEARARRTRRVRAGTPVSIAVGRKR